MKEQNPVTEKVNIMDGDYLLLLYQTNTSFYLQDKTKQKEIPFAAVSSSEVPTLTKLVDKVPELLSISSISAETTTNKPRSVHGISIIQCNEQWKSMKLDAKAQQQLNQKKIDCFVKEHLFKKV